MKEIQKFLTEGYPKNPDTIILKNSFYPNGLREIDIYNHYMSVKDNLLEWIGNNEISFFLSINGKTVVKRKSVSLTRDNYKDSITGRTLSVYINQKRLTDSLIIDVDLHKNSNDIRKLIKYSKEFTKILKMNFSIKWIQSLYSSQRGIHINTKLNRKFDVDKLRIKCEKIFSSEYSKDSNVSVNDRSQSKREINIDLNSTMREKSLYISKYSLTKDGLICNSINLGYSKIQGIS